MKRLVILLTLAAALAVPVATASPADPPELGNIGKFSLVGVADGGGQVRLLITNTLEHQFLIRRDGYLIMSVTGNPTFIVTLSRQPLGIHVYRAFTRTAVSNQVTLTVR